MRYFLFCWLVINFSNPCISQSKPKANLVSYSKPVIDSAAINHWITLNDDRAISCDGKYFLYNISNYPAGGNTLVVRSLTDRWERSFSGGSMGTFSGDGKQLIFMRNDTLSVLSLGKDSLKIALKVSSYKFSRIGNVEWLAYELGDSTHELVLHNLFTGSELKYDSVIEYSFDDNGNSLIFKTSSMKSGYKITRLQFVNIYSLVTTQIWTSSETFNNGDDIINYTVDFSGKQVAFIIQEKSENSIWYFKDGMDRAVKRVDRKSSGIDSGLSISGSDLKFSDDGRYIFFKTQNIENIKPKPDFVSVDIWSYRDTVLQGTQLYDLDPKIYYAGIATDGNNVVRLTMDYEEIKALPTKGDFAVIGHNDQRDRFWLHKKDENLLISLKDGSRQVLPTGDDTQFIFSPDGRYLVFYIFNKTGNYYSEDLTTGIVKKISGLIPNQLNVIDEFSKDALITNPVGVAGWLDDRKLLVYDNYDIWQLDLDGHTRELNITQGYGFHHHIKFRIAGEIDNTILEKKRKPILLMAFNTINKQNGFYQIEFSKIIKLRLLIMGAWTLDHQGASALPGNAEEFNNGMVPLKARDANYWVFLRQTATEAPNYFLTRDFNSYQALTNLQPQAKFNWLTTELISWKQLDGTVSQGILYKPEDFDPQKKYPVLFNYYEQLSQRLFEFPIVDYTRNSINIPWFVSRGYLVFTPDIHFVKGHMGESAYNAVISAALLLSKLPYVDSRRMGLNGHSFGGFETNYLVTHSHLFSAAVEGAGTSDWISSSLELSGVQGKIRSSRLGGYEGAIGASLWRRPDLFFENSPILHADKVSTPLLIFHSKDDTAVPWEQAVELFIALRRLEKKTWMLQYDGQSHGNYDNGAEDFTIRITQFFDHYLKDKPAPVWMTQGIPARDKGRVTGFEPDNTGRKP